MNFEARASEVLTELVLQSLIDKANGITSGYANLRAVLETAIREAYEEGRKRGIA